jgi:hypothetical protein
LCQRWADDGIAKIKSQFVCRPAKHRCRLAVLLSVAYYHPLKENPLPHVSISGNAMAKQDFDYDVCFSFAGEDREYVEKVAANLIALGVRVFYDRYEQAVLWGKDLYVHLADV